MTRNRRTIFGQRCFRLIRANAKEWGVDPKRVGIMGFSAGGEQSGLVALQFDEGKADATDPIERFRCRPDFTVLVFRAASRTKSENHLCAVSRS